MRNLLYIALAISPFLFPVAKAENSAPKKTVAQKQNPTKVAPKREVPKKEEPKKEESSGAKLIEKGGSGNEPVLIKSKTVQLNAKDRVFVYRESVEINKGDVLITSDVVTGKYNEANEITTIICEGNVVITRGPELRASSNRADYDVPSGKIVLTQGPELNDRGNILSADKVTLWTNEDRSEAEGNVRVKVLKSTEAAGPGVGKKKDSPF